MMNIIHENVKIALLFVILEINFFIRYVSISQ